MNADAFRHFYEYHFAENRKIWDTCITPLSHEQFAQGVGYSHGSVRNQMVHLMDVDDIWFSQLRGVQTMEPLGRTDSDDRGPIRVRWAAIEQRMRDFLAALRGTERGAVDTKGVFAQHGYSPRKWGFSPGWTFYLLLLTEFSAELMTGRKGKTTWIHDEGPPFAAVASSTCLSDRTGSGRE